MKKISHTSSNMMKVESVLLWQKCDFCGTCHPKGAEHCPRVKWVKEHFGAPRDGNT